jgi:hypothetical protein
MDRLLEKEIDKAFTKSLKETKGLEGRELGIHLLKHIEAKLAALKEVKITLCKKVLDGFVRGQCVIKAKIKFHSKFIEEINSSISKCKGNEECKSIFEERLEHHKDRLKALKEEELDWSE